MLSPLVFLHAQILMHKNPCLKIARITGCKTAAQIIAKQMGPLNSSKLSPPDGLRKCQRSIMAPSKIEDIHPTQANAAGDSLTLGPID